MKHIQLIALAIIAALVALEAVVYAQPAPNNCGLNMLCRIRTLVVSGNSTMTGDVTANNVILDGGSCLCLNGTGACTVKICPDGFGGITAAYGGGYNATGSFGVTGAITTDDYMVPKTGLKNTATSAACSSNTGAVCVNDTGGLAVADGAGATVATITAAGLISGTTGVSSGAWHARWGGVIPESTNSEGGYRPTTVGLGTKFRQICCSCRVAGSGGTTGIVLSLMEDGIEVGTTEINAGVDTNACDDAAGTLLCGDINYGAAAGSAYQLQVKSSTDCAGNPTDCDCDVDVTR